MYNVQIYVDTSQLFRRLLNTQILEYIADYVSPFPFLSFQFAIIVHTMYIESRLGRYLRHAHRIPDDARNIREIVSKHEKVG